MDEKERRESYAGITSGSTAAPTKGTRATAKRKKTNGIRKKAQGNNRVVTVKKIWGKQKVNVRREENRKPGGAGYMEKVSGKRFQE